MSGMGLCMHVGRLEHWSDPKLMDRMPYDVIAGSS